MLRDGLEGGGVGGVACDKHVADSIGVAIVPLYEDAVLSGSGGNGGVAVVGVLASTGDGAKGVVVGIDIDAVEVGSVGSRHGDGCTGQIGRENHGDGVVGHRVGEADHVNHPLVEVIAGGGSGLGYGSVTHVEGVDARSRCDGTHRGVGIDQRNGDGVVVEEVSPSFHCTKWQLVAGTAVMVRVSPG